LNFLIPCVPVAQPRARATAINGKARMFEAKAGHAIHSYKATLRLAVASVFHGAPMEGALSARIVCVFPRRKTMPKRMGICRLPCCKRPDVDNLAKGTLDALNGLLFLDDAQIVDCRVEKWIAAEGEQPHVELIVEAHYQNKGSQ
jgi:Holliday junction resolvase RusA-like endonuclease